MTGEKLRRMQEENLNKNAASLKAAWGTDCRSLNEDFSGYVGAPPVYYNCATRQAFSICRVRYNKAVPDNHIPNPKGLMARHLRISVADTVLDANDTGGDGFPLLLLSGQFATQRSWKKLLRLLGGRYRIVTYDTRARGHSGSSNDYSFASNVDDISAVLKATGIQKPVLVGWSYGAALAVRYAALHPDAVSGIVSIDGAYPMAPMSQAERERIRKTWRWMGPLMKVAAAFGLSARMSAAQAAESNIELIDVLSTMAADYEKIRCPVAFIVGTGKHMGAREEDLRKMRAGIDPIVKSRPNVTVFATVPASHTQVLPEHPEIIAAAIDAVVGETQIRA